MRFKKGNEYFTVDTNGTVFKDGKIVMTFESEYEAIDYLKENGYEECGYAGR